MEVLNSLPGDNEIKVPLDPSRAELVLPDNDEKVELKLPDEVSPLGETYDKVRDLDPLITAQKIELAKKINEPELYVDKNFDNLKKIDFDRGDGYWADYQKRNPIVSEMLKEPKVMAMAKNDIDKLADIEKTVQDQSFANDLWDGLQKGLASTNANIARIPSLAYNMAALPQNMAAKALGRPDLQVSAPDSLIDNPIANFYDKQTKAYSSSDASESVSDQIAKGDYKNAAKNLAVQVVTNSPSQMISIVLGLSGAGLIPSLAVSGGIQGSGTLKESLDKGADPASATLNAAYQGTFEAGMESLSFGTIGALRQSLTKAFGKESARKVILEFGKEITTSMASEGKEEFLTQLAQDFSSYATGVDTGALNGTLGRALDAGLIGAASGGAMNAPAFAIASRTRLVQIKKTDVLKKQYSDLGKIAISTELSKNSPDTQVAMISNLTEGTPVENIYLPVEQAQVYFQSKGLNLEAVGKEVGIENEVKEAVETGSDIKIPLAKWIAKLANTEHYEALKDDIKYSPEDFTARQNKDYNDEIFNLLDAENKLASENQKLSEDQKAQANVVYESLRDELVNRGQSSDVAEKNAKIYQSYVTIKAARDGISIEESNKELRPTIVNGDNQAFERKAIPEFNSESVVNADQVKAELIKMGLPEIYQSPEAISAIRSQLDVLRNEISQAEAGKRNFREGEAGGDVIVEAQKSTFPKWFGDNGFKTKKDFDKAISQGNSKNLSKIIDLAIKGLREGYGENPQSLLPPNLDFVALVDPESLDGSIEATKMMAQGKSFDQSVFHGTPHRFEEFKLNKIGSGEGHQVYGWGLYFSKSKDVANYYRRMLTGETERFSVLTKEEEGDLGRLNMLSLEGLNTREIETKLSDLKDTYQVFIRKFTEPELSSAVKQKQRQIEIINKVLLSGNFEFGNSKPGQLYQVDLSPEDGDLLNYDVPLRDMGEGVKKGISELKKEYIETEGESGAYLADSMTGEQIYKEIIFSINKKLNKDKESLIDSFRKNGIETIAYGEMVKQLSTEQLNELNDINNKLNNTQEAASKLLLSVGIPGIIYEDAQSRAVKASEGKTHNFVIFDDSKVKIEKTFYQSSPAQRRIDGEQVKQTRVPLPESLNITSIKDNMAYALKGDALSKRIDQALFNQTLKNDHTGLELNITDQSRGKIKSDIENFSGKRQPVLTKDLLRAIGNIDELLKNAVFYEESGDIKGKPREWEYFFSPTVINGRDFLIQFQVNKLKNNEVYFTKIEQVKRERGSNATLTASPADFSQGLENLPLSTITLSEFEKEFNEATGKNKHFQINQGDTKRGSIEFRKEEKIITLHKEADRSTFLHEMGHLFLQDFYEHVLSGDASNRAINDWMKLSAWLDYNPAQTELTVDQHEKWARGFEAYLMEGKAPSKGLQKTFNSFRKWLTRIYKSVKALDVELSDDVREIMDRMLATDEEIALARRKTGLETKLDLTGIPQEVISKLESIKAMAEEKAFAMMFKDQMRDISKEHKDFIKSKTKEVTAQVKFEIESSPEGQEILDLQKAVKSKDLVKVANDFINGEMTEEKSVAFEMLAEDMGYSSGDHLAKAMMQMKPIAEQVKAEVETRMKEFSASTDENVIRENAMRAIHNEKSVELLGLEKEIFRKKLMEETEKENERIVNAMEKFEEATLKKWLDAKERFKDNKISKLEKEVSRLVNREQERKIRDNQKKLVTDWLAAKDDNVRRQKAQEFRDSVKELNSVIAGYTRREAEAVKLKAKEILNKKSIKESTKFTQYFTAERNAALRVAKAVSNNDWGAAITAKQEQMLNHALARESIRISREVKRHTKYLNDQRTASRESFKNEDHLFQASKLMDRFGFTRSDFGSSTQGETLGQWETKYTEMNSSVAEWLLDERINKKTNELTIEELLDVRNTVQNIKKVANFENEISILDGKQKIEEIAGELIQASQQNFDPKDRFKNKFEDTKIDKLKGWSRLYMFSLKKIETVMGPLDAWKDNGVWNRIFNNTVYERANEESVMIQNATKEMGKNWEIYSDQERKDLYNKKIFIPEFNISTTKDKLLAMAHNLGNDGNKDRLFATRPVGLDESIAWGEGMVMSILQRELTAKDWKFVQANWDHLESYWSKIAALHRKLTGFTPGKVEHRKFSVVTSSGEKIDLNGGYYPLKSDPRNSFKDEVRDSADSPLYTEQNMAWKAATKKGHTKERVNAQYPVSLDLGIINRHLQDVIHDLAFRETVIELNKLIGRPDMQAEMKATLTPEGYKAVKEYIGAVAGGQGGDPVSAIDKVIKVLRQNTIKAALFWKVSVVSQNFANALIFPNAVEGFGYADAFKSYFKYGIGDYAIKMFSTEGKEIREMVYGKSSFMKDRADSPDYSIEEVHSKFKKGEASEISKMAGGMMAWTDEFSNIPMWLGAYNKSISEGKSEAASVKFADTLIMRVAGSSRKYDVASISRGTETQKIFSMFFSWLNTEHQRWMREVGIFNRDKDVSRALGFLAGRLVFQVAGAALMFRLPDPDDEEEVKKFIANITIGYPLSFFPGMRDVAQVVIDKSIGVKGFGYNPSPAFAAIDYGLGGFGAMVDAAEGKIDEKVAVEKMSKAASYGFGYPDQFNQWFFNMYDYTNGMEPKLQDIYRRRPKKER